jgi:hypothetical protein
MAKSLASRSAVTVQLRGDGLLKLITNITPQEWTQGSLVFALTLRSSTTQSVHGRMLIVNSYGIAIGIGTKAISCLACDPVDELS